MSVDAISLRETLHEGPHDEEDVYGEDYTLIFEAGSIDNPAAWRSGIVTARICPKRENEPRKMKLGAIWWFPPISEPHETLIVESSNQIGIEEMQTAASGLMAAIETRAGAEIEEVHERFRQAALTRSEG